MKRKIAALLAVLMLVTSLTSCGARPVPEGVDEEAAGKAGEAIVALMLDGDCQGVVDAFDPDMREKLALTADQVELVLAPVLDAGAYVSTYKVMVVGGKSSGYDGEYITVGIYCEHEKTDIVYEMSFDTDLELIGLTAEQQRKTIFG